MWVWVRSTIRECELLTTCNLVTGVEGDDRQEVALAVDQEGGQVATITAAGGR